MMRSKIKAYKWGGVITLLMCFIFCTSLFAQNTYRLTIHLVDNDSTILKLLSLKTSFQNRASCEIYISHLPVILQSKGYFNASVDTVIYGDNYAALQLYAGEKNDDASIRIRKQDMALLNALSVLKNKRVNETTNLSGYKIGSEKLLDYYENNGYPFAAINLDSITVEVGRLNAVMNVDKGFLYHIDSIRLFGNAKISRNFLHHYTNIERGSPYSKEKIDKIDKRILQLPYMQQLQPSDVSMLQTGSVINLYLQPKKSNQINVLAGFLPSNQQLGGKLLFTIDANLQLQNAFSSGESLGVVWQQLQPKSPRLNLQYTQPYIFNSSFGVDFLFNLYKKDSAFLNINGQLGLLYYLSANNTAKVILQTQQTNVLQVDTNAVKATKQLPDVADVSSFNLGFDYDVFNTNYKFNPQSGNELNASLFIGNKTIKKNTAITAIKDTTFNYSQLYDSVKLKTYQLRFRIKAAHYFKTGKQSAVKTGLNAGWFESPTNFRNEFFQIGGYKLLRGFDEESIFANTYAVATLEYRYLLDVNSNFFAFTDFGWSNNKIINQSNTYLGIGVGLTFETKGGIFNLSYAVGKRNDLPFSFKQSKIHFGYVSIF